MCCDASRVSEQCEQCVCEIFRDILSEGLRDSKDLFSQASFAGCRVLVGVYGARFPSLILTHFQIAFWQLLLSVRWLVLSLGLEGHWLKCLVPGTTFLL